MSAPSVLYDAPGPKAKARNVGYTIAFLVALAAVIWWVLATMAEKGQLDGEKWSPFVTDGRIWTTFILPGVQNTLIAAGLSILIALPIGALFGILRLSDHVWVRWPSATVVEFFRAVPVLILMFFANEFYFNFTDIASDQRPLYAVVTGLVLYNGSVLAEVVRAGILSLPKGQTEAAQALGLRKTQTMTNVLLPQAVTAMLPAIVSQIVVIVKDTALGGAALGFAELLSRIRPISNNYGQNMIATLVIVAVIFIVLNFIITSAASWLEKWNRQRKKGTGAVVAPGAVDDVATGQAV
ncbi:amino acid ABC transporter permease [Prauserella sp. PE36]|uniref:Amino acid ABC transporter permease n=1 Tax=Prauserella endophytica TaxID=1592324 RepID=A0ABY2S1I3_9PSEU|nr:MULTISPECIES: amino acid ABC transporter permease [Prauserella]PXY25005.1 amino acid ABC transporter permease [Prauserella coralliicola]RBM23813.1 amino acid ABC transporter permease [Prauserella sp. PE36]TKG69082.1 amino acid ABC transporter permease [Prauserella endophytica]